MKLQKPMFIQTNFMIETKQEEKEVEKVLNNPKLPIVDSLIIYPKIEEKKK